MTFMTGISRESIIASARVYQIHVATELLNQTIRETWPQAESEPLPLELQFIERSWFEPEESDSPHFKFTYFRVSSFQNKAAAILDTIDKQRHQWGALLKAVDDYVRARPSLRTHLNKTIEFFTTLLDLPARGSIDPGELHYRFADLQASLPVDNYMPGALWGLHAKRQACRDHQPWQAYHVFRNPNAKSPPPLTIVPRPLQSQSDSPGALHCYNNIPQLAASWLSKHPGAEQAYFELTQWLTLEAPNHLASGPDQKKGYEHTLWVPLYEYARDDRFHGRFLGWLFCLAPRVDAFPTNNGSLPNEVSEELCRSFTRQHLRACITLSGRFAAEFVRIDRHNFIGSLPKANAGRREPASYLKELRDWEGWKSAEPSMDRPKLWPTDREWWHMDHDNRVLHIRLDPTSHDDPVDWGQFKELGYISLDYHESSPIPTDTVANLQVRGVRELTRQLAVMVRGLRDAEHAKAREQAGAWAHEVKNYAGGINALLHGVRYHSADSADSDFLDLALQLSDVLGGVAIAIQEAFDGALRRPAGSTSFSEKVANALFFLCAVRSKELAVEHADDVLEGRDVGGVQLQLDPPAPAGVITRLDANDTECILAIALLREVIQNIRNDNPASDQETITTIGHAIEASTGSGKVSITLTQKQVETSDRSGSAETPRGIVRANKLFGRDGFDLGGIEWSKPLICSLDDNTWRVARTVKVYWFVDSNR